MAWHAHSQQKTKPLSNLKAELHKTLPEQLNQKVEEITETTEPELTASANKTDLPRLNKFVPKQIQIGNDSCADVIVFRDGTEMTAKVVEIFNGTIKYLPCNNLDGPLRVSNGDKIFMVKYANGTKEVFKETAKTSAPTAKPQAPKEKELNMLALASFILSMFWFLYFIPAIVACILGIIAMKQINANPEKYKNRWMAKFGIIVFFVVSGLIVLSYIGV